jgi:broad specificity phosphatase PhoE
VSATTRVFLVRHGATVLSAEDRFAGSTDVLLSDEGRRQAARLADRLGPEAIAAVYASPMQRTRETAAILAASHRLEVRTHEAFREIDHGRWEQMTRAEVEARYPDEYAAWESDPFTFAPQGGESGISVMARALPALRELVVRHRGEKLLLVSHKATLRLLIASLLGFDARGYRDRLDQSPCCLDILDFRDPARARLALFNDVSHYAGQPDPPKAGLSKWWDPGEGTRDAGRAP